MIVDNLQCACQHIMLQVEIKFGYWEQLPWVLAGLSHPDQNVARLVGRKIIGSWTALTPEQREHSHHRTKEFLTTNERYEELV